MKTGHVFEIRTYTAEPGKLDAMHARFRDHVLRLFDKHGITNVGYFAPTDEQLSTNTLIYILSFPSREAAQKSWEEFRNDPEWQKVRAGVGSQREAGEPKWSRFSSRQPTIHR